VIGNVRFPPKHDIGAKVTRSYPSMDPPRPISSVDCGDKEFAIDTNVSTASSAALTFSV
jgi:hypothetical protein